MTNITENRKSLEFSSPDNHQYATVNSKENYSSYLSEDGVAGDNDKQVSAHLSEKLESPSIKEFYRCHRKLFSILYQLATHPKTILASSAPADYLFSIVGDVITKPINNLSPAKIKMLAVVKKKVLKIKLCDVSSGVESGHTNIDEDPDFCAKITREINEDLVLCAEITQDIDDNSDGIILDNEDEDRDCNYFGDGKYLCNREPSFEY